MANVRERRVLSALVLALFGLLALITVHYVQDIAYWKVLEDTVETERASRQRWQHRAEDLKRRVLSADVGEGAEREGVVIKQQASGGDIALVQTDTAAKECPKCPKCLAAAEESGSFNNRAASKEGNLLDFKVYVYDLPAEFHSTLKAEQPRCVNDQYGTEILFHEQLLRSPLLTKDPKEAEFFFVPIYGECYLFRETQKNGKTAFDNTNVWYKRAMDVVMSDFPHWNATGGRDHLFVFAGARGAHIFKDWKNYIKRSIFLTPEGDRTLGEQFNTWKDVVIPGLEIDRKFATGELRNSRVPRDIFASFRGTIHNKGGSTYSRGIRILMEQAFKNMTDVVFSEPSSKCNRDCYRDQMRRSTFCLCPRGWSPWTLRTYQAMMVGCIPVIIADEIEFPYESSLDWSQLTIKISEAKAVQTISILRSMSTAEVERKQKAIEAVWHMMAYQLPAQPGDAFYSIMQDLGRKKRRFKHSTTVFWN